MSERPRAAILRSNSISISAEDLTSGRIEGFRIQPDDSLFLQVGIQLLDCAVEVVDNEITGTVTAGMELQGSGGSVVRSNSIQARSRAALVIGGDGDGPRIVHNTLMAEGHPAIVVTGGASPSIAGNIIRAAEPFFVPPHLKVQELLQANYVTPLQRPPGRSSTRQDASARVR